jgi:hypothetical protein
MVADRWHRALETYPSSARIACTDRVVDACHFSAHEQSDDDLPPGAVCDLCRAEIERWGAMELPARRPDPLPLPRGPAEDATIDRYRGES